MICEFCNQIMIQEDDEPFIFRCHSCATCLYEPFIVIQYHHSENIIYDVNVGKNRTVIIRNNFAKFYSSKVLLDVNEKLDITPTNIEEKIKQLEFYS